jgi:hypothetical protein
LLHFDLLFGPFLVDFRGFCGHRFVTPLFNVFYDFSDNFERISSLFSDGFSMHLHNIDLISWRTCTC